MSPPRAVNRLGSLRRSQATSVRTGQHVRSGGRSSFKAATHGLWAFSRLRRMATSGPVSATARLITTEAFHVHRVCAQVSRRPCHSFDAPDEARPIQKVEHGFFGGHGLIMIQLGFQLEAQPVQLVGGKAFEAPQKMIEFSLCHDSNSSSFSLYHDTTCLPSQTLWRGSPCFVAALVRMRAKSR